MVGQQEYYAARALRQREIAAELTGAAREQHLTLAAMYEALATEPRSVASGGRAAACPDRVVEDERAYLQRRAREERARAADSDDPEVRRIRFEMADEYLRRADAVEA